MLKTNLQPPPAGPGQNPVLHGVASGLAKLFPPVEQPSREAEKRRQEPRTGRD